MAESFAPGAVVSEVARRHERPVLRQDEDQRDTLRITDALQRCRGGLRKFHHKPPGAEVAPELLAKEHLNIWLVVDYKNQQAHVRTPLE